MRTASKIGLLPELDNLLHNIRHCERILHPNYFSKDERQYNTTNVSRIIDDAELELTEAKEEFNRILNVLKY